ncbi:MAG: FAD-dependent oxidoreductase [Anaerolineae bacterium]|nr:FAD-dependent oxidoreductase [Anaerolineae bacterium]
MANADNGQPVGAVLVVGAGIGGMQAALDLAEAGLKVYLLDKAPAIGGVMAQLDKTFPTNDCAMCIMSPKLVDVGRHLNIELLTCADVERVEGEPGHFTVTVKQHPRYVDVAKCTGCGDCAAACPITRRDDFNCGLSERHAIYKLYPQAIPNAYAIEKLGTSPCRDACPIHQRAQGYVALVAEGRYADAYRTILQDNPFPSICGRVCNHCCEDACSRGKVDGPVNIMALKRFVADWACEHPEEVAQAKGQSAIRNPQSAIEARVAVIGAGPAGLTCALDLVRLGYAVTVFEALPVAGGMMRVGVPGYRLPPEVVQREIDAIIAEGVELKLNHRVEDAVALLEDYDAVFVAVGAHAGITLPIPGVDLPGVLTATDFLRQVALSADLRSAISDKRILVLGGGNVAVDAAMTAVRLGAAWVGMACLESREKMPAHEWEILDAQEEGIELFPSRTFQEITSRDGQVAGVRCVEVDFRGFVDGRPDFDTFPETEHVIPADVVIFAIGQRPDVSCLGDEVEKARGRFPVVDKETLATSVPGLFAGGDVVTGTQFIVDAIAAGHRAAWAIDLYLQGRLAGQSTNLPIYQPAHAPLVELSEAEAQARVARGEASPALRHERPKRPAAERRRDFREVYGGLTEEAARAEAARCLACGVCSECLQCVFACQANAIDHSQVEQEVQLNVGAVLLVPGVEPLPGDIRPEFGYGRYPNVVTSLEFERMLSASGPFAGEVKRPSDGQHPRKVAWIQCVGSRDITCEQGYCSSVCCMYATKEAMIAREHDAHIEPTIFYMDIRSFGKGFERYIEQAEREYGVRYVRSMVSAVKEAPGTHNLRLTYVTFEDSEGAETKDEGRGMKRPVPHEEEFDLVVLAVGLRPSADTVEMAHRLGIELNDYGFAEPELFTPGRTSRPGIFVAGAFAEPKDIPETVIEASCAAAQASALLAPARHTLTRMPEYPVERDVSDEPPRVGVFVCHCGINIGAVVDVPDVVEYARTLPDVVYAERNLYTCSQDTQERIVECIREQGLNRVIVASCTPRTHEPLFQDTLRQAGLNPHLFYLANIREQDAWVHRATPAIATAKAKDLVRMAVAKVRRLRPIQRGTFDVDHHALVIGGGLAGMTAALSIAGQGYPVYLVEREQQLGGNLRHIHVGLPVSGSRVNPQGLLHDTIEAVSANPLISVFTGAEVEEVSGYMGKFRSLLRLADGKLQEVSHGAIVVATGAREITPTEYGYGELPGVLTQRELEGRIAEAVSNPQSAFRNPQSVVMIQCVGSRNETHPYCSRICCTEAIKNALEIKRLSPQSEVTILYRDIRSYGFKEELYREARRQGVVFLEYDKDRPPSVSEAASQRVGESASRQVVGSAEDWQGRRWGELQVEVAVQPENEVVTLPADLVVLSAGIEPNADNDALARLLKLPLNQDGFFLEAHMKLRPVDFAADGIYLAGLAHSPRFLEETIAQAQAAAIRAVTLLSKTELAATPIVASVNPRLCSACGLCVEVCPYDARVLEPGAPHAEVIEVLCQGCGACIVACPNKASQQKGFEFGQIFSMVDAALVAV